MYVYHKYNYNECSHVYATVNLSYIKYLPYKPKVIHIVYLTIRSEQFQCKTINSPSLSMKQITNTCVGI